MKKYDGLRCRDCPSYKFCRGKVMKGSSVCDRRRGIRSKSKSKRYSYLKGMIGR